MDTKVVNSVNGSGIQETLSPDASSADGEEKGNDGLPFLERISARLAFFKRSFVV
jgi:hypothetical protein